MRLRVHAPALIGLAAACTPSQPVELPWAIEFAAGAPRPPDVTTVRAWIRADGCDGTPVYSVVVSEGSTVGPEPPHLDDGTWAFGADALDAQCRLVASACTEIVVPRARRVTLTLDPVDPPGAGCVAPAVCVAGACARSDGGRPDAGRVDAGARRDAGGDRDAGPELDAGGDPDAGAAVDAGERCTGCVSGEMCLPGTTNTACGRAGDACEVCTGGECASNGECCTGCIYGGTCRAGASSARCGTGGAPCVNCLDTGQSCTAGSCS